VKKWSLHGIKYLLLLSFIFPLLAGCSSSNTIKEQYPLESVNGSGSQTSYVYRAAGQTVPETAKLLIEQRKPQQQSKDDTERMFLVYSDEIIHLQKASDVPADTLIEVDSKEYVRQNYSPGFLEGYLLASVLGNLFDNGRYGGDYRGYSSRDTYQPKTTYHKPTDTEKKLAPPMTVEKSGSIFRRSKGTDSTAARSGSSTGSSSKGKITRGSGDGSSSSGGFFSKAPKKYKPPRMSSGRGRIGRRR
jgi:hypothetical protein